jgi:hypothetical protein
VPGTTTNGSSPTKGSARNGPSPSTAAGGTADALQVEFFQEDEEDEDYDDDDNNADHPDIPTNLSSTQACRRTTSDRESALIAGAAEDSQEAFCTKTLSELALLVVQSLSLSSDDHINYNNDATSSPQQQQILSMEDSILSEARIMSSSTMGGVMAVGSDLGATVASLMHHVPVLRHDHVAVRIHDIHQQSSFCLFDG